MTPKIIIVGSGLFGLTIAELVSSRLNMECLVLEKRSHIGGNAWSYKDTDSQIDIHKYGTHIFHTSNLEVWKYVNRFTEFNQYRHTVWTKYKNQFFSMPINLSTISQFYGRTLSPNEARELLKSESEISLKNISDNENFENIAISKVGKPLYRALFEGYTQKQWQINPKDLPSDIFGRLPIRYNFNNSYFSDSFEGIPIDGYGNFIKNIASNKKIKIEVDTDYFAKTNSFADQSLLIYTGALDRFFNYKYGVLGWRTLDFELEKLDIEDFQGTSVINFAEVNVPYTRIHEFKHLHPEKEYQGKTIIMREYSRVGSQDDEPYYPVNSIHDRRNLSDYRVLASKQSNVIFGGRLGSYKYLDMHMAIASAMSVFENKIKPRFI